MRVISGAARPAIRNPRWTCASCIRRLSTSGTNQLATKKEQRNLPGSPARTRFAPSPTGFLHLGSLRTALFNYLLARATGGQFLLRVEDTDQKRTIPNALERLCQDLRWAGLDWDEGPEIGGPYGPYQQSKRTPLYQQHALKLLESGSAYRCFCSQTRLKELAEHRHQAGLPTDYDRACAHIGKEESDDRAHRGESHVIRLLAPPKYPEFTDLVYGKVRNRQISTLEQIYPAYDDPILLKGDGFPTYHLANVVDDHLMQITHVVRGSEWMSSTPKHLAMYHAFGWEPPRFAHVGLLLDEKRQKLSKRNLDTDISSFRDKGIFPESLVNFVALLGWSHREPSDVMGLPQLIEKFSLKLTTGNTVVTFGKLDFLQRAHADRYVREDRPETGRMAQEVLNVALNIWAKKNEASAPSETAGVRNEQARFTKEFAWKIVKADARNYTNAAEFVDRNRYFFEAPSKTRLEDTKLDQAVFPGAPEKIYDRSGLITSLVDQISSVNQDDWTSQNLKKVTNSYIDEQTSHGLLSAAKSNNEEDNGYSDAQVHKTIKKGVVSWTHKFLRWAVTAGNPGPDGAEVMAIIGREETLRRLNLAVQVEGLQ